eukprot:2170247-Prorocentrum_lima.AAC.1
MLHRVWGSRGHLCPTLTESPVAPGTPTRSQSNPHHILWRHCREEVMCKQRLLRLRLELLPDHTAPYLH